MDGADRAVQDEHTRPADLLFRCIETAVPSLAESILLSVPNTVAPPSVRVGGMMGPEDKAALRSALDALVATTTVPADGGPVRSGSDVVDWMITTFLPGIAQIALLTPSPSCNAMEKLCFVTAALLRDLGASFSSRIARAVVQGRLGSCKDERERSRLIMLYVLAVLVVLPSEELIKWLRTSIQDIALSKNGWTIGNFRALKASLSIACTSKGGGKHGAVLSVLSELVTNPNSKIRSCVASVFSAITGSLSAEDIATKELPALVSLATDPDPDVRSENSMSLATVFASHVADQPTVDKAAVVLESLSDDKTFKVRVAVCRSFGDIAQQVKPVLIEHFIAPKLAQISENIRQIEGDSDKAEVASAVWQAFRQYQGTGLSGSAVVAHVIPALRGVVNSTPALDPGVRQSVEAKLKQLEVAVSALKPATSPTHPTTSAPQTASSAQTAPAPATAATGGAAAVKQLFSVFRIGKT